MKIAFLAPDNRENFRKYDLPEPCFGTAPSALLEGFAMLGNEKVKSGTIDRHSPGNRHDEFKPFEVHVISCTQRPLNAPEKLAPNIWYHSLHVPKIGWLRTGYQGCIRAVRNKLREIKPDVVHAQGTERDCAISAVLSPYPRVLTIHGNLRLIRKQLGFRPLSAIWFQSYLEGWVVPRFAGVICITNYTREAVEHEVPKTWVVPNAVDPAFLALGEKRLSASSNRLSTLDSRFSPPIILCVATIDPRKNQKAFITALDSLAKHMNFEVRFFGGCNDSDYEREFKELIASRPWCRYGGMIGRGELRNQFGQAAMLALPTHEDNCPMVVLEAMAAGVPVMASKVGGIPDLIDGIKTGLFCDPSAPESFVDGVSRLLGDPVFAGEIARNAYDEAAMRFHPKQIARRHLDIYHEVFRK